MYRTRIPPLRRRPAAALACAWMARKVGSAGLPSTVLGLLYHAAEHSQRHTGQLIVTAKVARAGATP